MEGHKIDIDHITYLSTSKQVYLSHQYLYICGSQVKRSPHTEI